MNNNIYILPDKVASQDALDKNCFYHLNPDHFLRFESEVHVSEPLALDRAGCLVNFLVVSLLDATEFIILEGFLDQRSRVVLHSRLLSLA